MAKPYSHKFPIGVYWNSLDGKNENSCFYTDVDYAKKKVAEIKEHNKSMGHLHWDTTYVIKQRVPIQRKRKAKE